MSEDDKDLSFVSTDGMSGAEMGRVTVTVSLRWSRHVHDVR